MITAKLTKASIKKYKFALVDDNIFWHYHGTSREKSRLSKLLLMAEILHHLGCMKPYEKWEKLPINWCRISAINSSTSLERCAWLLRNHLQGSTHRRFIGNYQTPGCPGFTKQKQPSNWRTGMLSFAPPKKKHLGIRSVKIRCELNTIIYHHWSVWWLM